MLKAHFNMLIKNLCLLFFLLICSISFAQKKKKVDTVYVYEKVIVRDTVFLLKPLIVKQKSIISPTLSLPNLQIKNNPILPIKKPETKEKTKDFQSNSFQMGAQIGIGLKNNFGVEESPQKKLQFGENLGIWISKSLFNQPLQIILSANVYHWNSSFDMDANEEDTFLNGYYFSGETPLLFQKFNNKHFEYVLETKLAYNWKNFRPFVGFLVNKSSYKMQFLVPENMVLSKLDDFKSNAFNFGFSFGINYHLSRKLSFGLMYQQIKIKIFSFKNETYQLDILKSKSNISEKKWGFGLDYVIF